MERDEIGRLFDSSDIEVIRQPSINGREYSNLTNLSGHLSEQPKAQRLSKFTGTDST